MTTCRATADTYLCWVYTPLFTILAQILKSCLCILIFYNFHRQTPPSLIEAAEIDGANHFRTLFQIFMPLAKPIIAVLAIYTFVGVWNGWSTANIYLRDTSLQPLQLYLRRMLQQASETLKPGNPKEQAAMEEMRMVAMSLQYALIIFTTLPVLVVYPFFQKYFVKGVMVGSVKG